MSNIAVAGAIGASGINLYTTYNQGNMIQAIEKDIKTLFIRSTEPTAAAGETFDDTDIITRIEALEGKVLLYI